MREIKFRAWDKKSKELGYQITKYVVAEDGTEYRFLAFSFSYGIVSLTEALESDRYDLQQYTGLKDKNGVEIYEGDIVDVHSWKPSIKETRRQIVTWTNCGLFMVRADKSVSGRMEMTATSKERLEVIGNIYENKELLK